jgi:transcriptional regulator with XRE-family HTH domain
MRRLKLLRLNQRKTQWEVGRAAGFSQGRYSMIERGLIEPTPAERERLAAVLNAPASTLLRPAFRERGSQVIGESGHSH